MDTPQKESPIVLFVPRWRIEVKGTFQLCDLWCASRWGCRGGYWWPHGRDSVVDFGCVGCVVNHWFTVTLKTPENALFLVDFQQLSPWFLKDGYVRGYFDQSLKVDGGWIRTFWLCQWLTLKLVGDCMLTGKDTFKLLLSKACFGGRLRTKTMEEMNLGNA